jgi:hypothetical protein
MVRREGMGTQHMIGWVGCVFLFGGRSGGKDLVLRSELGTAGVQFRARDAKGWSVKRKCRSKRLRLVASFTLSQVSSGCLSSRFIWALGCGNPPVMLCLMLAAELLRVPSNWVGGRGACGAVHWACKERAASHSCCVVPVDSLPNTKLPPFARRSTCTW